MPIPDGPIVERPFDVEAFRLALGQYPTGVTIVTANLGDEAIGITANSFASVSLDPPLVSWCVSRRSTHAAAFVAAPSFAIHFLGAEHGELARLFAERGGGRFEGLKHRIGALGAPIIADLAPVFECRTWARYPGGDHTILVGEVAELVTRIQDPLVFHAGAMRRF